MLSQQGRDIAVYGAAAVGGCLLLFQLPVLPQPAWLLLLLPLGFAARHPAGRVLLVCALGFVWAWWHAQQGLADRLDPALAGRDLVVSGRIVSLPERNGPALRFRFAPEGQAELPATLRLSWYYPETVPAAGERWRFTLRLREPRGFANPGGFDYEGWLFREGLGATGYVRDRPPPERLAPAAPGLLAMRAAVTRRIHEVLPADPFAGIVAGLAVGHAAGVDDAHWAVFRATGTVHLMAISGFHITMVGGLVYWLCSRLWRRSARLCERVPAPLAGAGAGLCVAAVYALLAGFSVPTQRTLAMLALAFGALLLRRAVRLPALLGGAALLVVLLDPVAVLAPGFWLSFGAVALILYVLTRQPRPAGWRAFLRAQLAVTLGLLPLLFAFFGQAPLAGPLANLVAIPLFSFLIVPLAVSGVVLPAPVDAWCYQGAAALLHLLWPLLEWLAAELPAWHGGAGGGAAAWLALAGGAVLLLAPRAVPARWLGCLAVLPLLGAPRGPAPGGFEFWLLDVGQGLAGVVRTAGHTLVYDAGPRFATGSDTGRLVVEPFLRARGLAPPSLLVISHSDTDHAGGADSLLAVWPETPVLAGQPPPDSGWRACRAGQAWRWDGVEFQVLHPGPDAPADDNARSCVLRVSAGEHALLLTGDIQAAVERALVRRQAGRLASELLVVPHHGSATSSTREFIAAVGPRHALAAAGYRNRWGFPRAEVLERYAAAGARVHETARAGALAFRVTPDRVEFLGGWRRRDARLWRAP